MTLMLSLVILSFVVIYSVESETTAPIVTTLNGPIRGKYYQTVFGKEILAFHRIPYIVPPIGTLRFKDPQPVANWTEVLDCSLPPIPSLNYNIMLVKAKSIIEGDETAIHINAYTAKLTLDKLLPVMIYIHGGAFVSDSASTRTYSPDYLLEKDIVLFTFNYRLGVLGFLSLDDPKLKVPGNAGLKDQTMALRWIKNNCDRFGGDPNSITLFGDSAGGASVHFHALSELSRGLFHRAVIMSGTAILKWTTGNNQEYGLQLAKSFGWNDNEPIEKALELLRNANGTELLNAAETLLPAELKLDVFQPFMPITEPYVSDQCFMSKPVTEMMIDPWSKDIPFIVSSTSDEGLILGLMMDLTDSTLFDNMGGFQNFIPKDLRSNSTERTAEYALRLKQIYNGDEQPAVFIKFLSDLWFIRAIYTVLQSRTLNSTAPTYLLRFAFDSRRFNHVKVLMELEDMPGASHADDLSYLFKNDYYESTGGLPFDSREFKTMRRMVDLYTNFAITSNPNGGEIGDAMWEPVKSDNLPYKCLNVGDELEFIDWPVFDRMKMWDQLYGIALN